MTHLAQQNWAVMESLGDSVEQFTTRIQDHSFMRVPEYRYVYVVYWWLSAAFLVWEAVKLCEHIQELQLWDPHPQPAQF